MQFFYDWRNRLVVTKSGVDGGTGASVQRPIEYFEYNNLDETTATELYDGDTDTNPGDDGNSDGVPDKPSSSLRRARSEFEYDNQGRLFRTETYSVNQSTGALSTNTLTTDLWFDHRGNVIKIEAPASPVVKYAYDGAGRMTKMFQTDGGGDSSWSDADDVTGDIVLEQMEYGYVSRTKF